MRRYLPVVALLLVAGCARPTAAPPASPTPSPPQSAQTPAPGVTPQPDAPLTAYGNRELGVRLGYPAGSGAPTVDATLGLIVKFDNGQVTITRQDHKQGESLKEVSDRLLVGNPSRVRTVDSGVKPLNGYLAGYAQFYFDSAAGRRDWITYAVPAGTQEYLVSCMTKEGPPPVPWEEIKPICERIFATLELGTDRGFISRAEAEAAALKGRQNVTVKEAILVELFAIRGRAPLPVWQVTLEPSGTIVLDADTGEILDQP